MNDRDIEDTRQTAWETEGVGEFECTLCEDCFPFTGGEVVINEKPVCDGCACEVADQAGYWDRMLKAERKVKEYQRNEERMISNMKKDIREEGPIHIIT